jgi:hypothetical protein
MIGAEQNGIESAIPNHNHHITESQTETAPPQTRSRVEKTHLRARNSGSNSALFACSCGQ